MKRFFAALFVIFVLLALLALSCLVGCNNISDNSNTVTESNAVAQATEFAEPPTAMVAKPTDEFAEPPTVSSAKPAGEFSAPEAASSEPLTEGASQGEREGGTESKAEVEQEAEREGVVYSSDGEIFDLIETSASYDGIEINVKSVKEYVGVSIAEDYSYLAPVRNGYKWVLVDLEIINGTEWPIGDISDYLWRVGVLDSDGNENEYQSVYMNDLKGDGFDFSSLIDPGQSRRGKFLFVVKAECNAYSLRYQPYERRMDDTVMEVQLRNSPDNDISDNKTAPSTGEAVETIETSASYNGIEINVKSVKEYPEGALSESYPELTPVQKGYKWVVADVEIVNGTDDAIGEDNDYGWRLDIRDNDGNDNPYASVFLRNLGEDAFDFSSLIESGQSRSGLLIFSLKANCHTYSLRYQPYNRSIDDTVMELRLR
ncbi:MAG: DUF4352 domain-containing protein [Oscillospiraceae bacterium]|nr:DUF4352 domain-containing protein [Oscillospiraceae bacterium]